MNKTTLAALRKSITKWKKIVAGTGSGAGRMNCALCFKFLEPWYGSRYLDEECARCPVNHNGTHERCAGTPYASWHKHHQRTDHAARMVTVGLQVAPGCKICKNLAQAELDFLVSLLPRKKK